MANETARVGLIGAGNMGGRMAKRVVEAGVPVLAYDVDASKVAAFGGTTAASVGEVADGSDIILLSLPDSSIIEPVCLGEGGLLEHGRSGQIVVDLSTANPTSTIELNKRFAEKGVAFVDAGISGGAAAAEKGTLTIMAGGDEQALERARWVIDHFAASIHYMGQSGAGHVTKVLNNFLNGISLAATAEVMVAAKKAGLDLEKVLEVLNTSSGVNYATLNRFPNIVKGNYMEGGLSGALMAKDMKLYLSLLEDLKSTSILGAPGLLAFQVSNALGYENVISNRIVDAYGDLSGGVRVSE